MLVVMEHRRVSGFSLVELLVAVGLFGILAVFAVPGYRVWVQNNLTRTAAESIRTGIQIARSEALKRNVPVQFDLRGLDSAWTICTRPTPAGACPNPDNTTTIQSRAVKEGSSTNVDIQFNTAGPYVFSPLGMLSGQADAVNIDVKNGTLSSADSRNLRVVIAIGGGVRICDPKVTDTTDPRIC